MRGAFPMPTRIRKRRWFVVVAFLGAAGIGIGIELAVGDALGRLHRGEGPPKPLPVNAHANSRSAANLYRANVSTANATTTSGSAAVNRKRDSDW
jgi:hypothetical protein